MRQILKKLEKAKSCGIAETISSRINEFRRAGKKESMLFGELCFCLLTANFNAERSIKIQEEIGDGFLEYGEKKLASELKRLGHRFPNMRARFIFEARKHKDKLREVLSKPEHEAREWLVNNVKGLGWKEASHFLRNVGFNDSAIIDFHIVDLLVENNVIERPKALTKNKYLEIEALLKEIASKSDLDLAELDLYLWCMETGKILK